MMLRGPRLLVVVVLCAGHGGRWRAAADQGGHCIWWVNFVIYKNVAMLGHLAKQISFEKYLKSIHHQQ